MKSSKMLAKLSLRLLGSSSMVVPFPIQSFFNQQLSSNLKTLLSSLLPERATSCNDDDPRTTNCLTVSFLARALDALVATQKLAHHSLAKSTFHDSDREAVERYLDDDNINLLDACNGLGDKLDNVCKYVKSMRLALHWLEGSSSMAVARADKLLESSRQSVEREGRKTARSTSSFKKLGDKITRRQISSRATKNRNHVRSELEEILDGSSVVTSTICETLDSAVSFKLNHRRRHNTTRIMSRTTPYSSYSSWLSSLQELRNSMKKETKKSLQVRELQETVRLSQELRQELRCQDYSKLRVRAEELQRSCDELDNGVKLLEGKVKEVYRYLMCVRMGLLGKLSSMA